MRRTLTALRVAFVAAAAPGLLLAQVSIQAGIQVGPAEHRTLDAGILVPVSGTLFGGTLEVLFGNRFEMRTAVLGGHFAERNPPTTDDHDIAELQMLGGVRVSPWLTVQAGPVLRTFSNTLARQHWTLLQLGATARVPLGFETVHGVVRGYWMPIAAVTGLAQPDLALALATGVEWRGRRIGASALYAFERYDFPQSGGTRRLEELSYLQFRMSFWTLAARH